MGCLAHKQLNQPAVAGFGGEGVSLRFQSSGKTCWEHLRLVLVQNGVRVHMIIDFISSFRAAAAWSDIFKETAYYGEEHVPGANQIWKTFPAWNLLARGNLTLPNVVGTFPIV